MKFSVAIIVALLVVMASANHLQCPTKGVKPLYNLEDTTCGRVDFCYTEFCKCIGGQYLNRTHTCPELATLDDCTLLSTCSRKNIRCLNEEAEISLANSQCRDWAQPVYLALVEASLATPEAYVNTSIYGACKYESCLWANQTRKCTPNYAKVCIPPPKYFGTLRLSGDWSKVIATTEKKAQVKSSLEADLTAELRTDVSVFDINLGSLIVDFNLQEADNATEALIAKAANSTAWLSNTKTTFTQLGGSGEVAVTYIGTTVVETPLPQAPPPPQAPGGGGDGQKGGPGGRGGSVLGGVVFIVLVGAVIVMKGKKGDSGEENELTTHEGGAKYASTHA